MAKPGDEYLDPDGGKIIFRQTAETSKGELLELEAIYPANSELPPEHYHPKQEERFEVLDGSLRTIINGRERHYKAGEEFTIPPGVPHGMHNVGSEEARIIWQTRPALKTEFFHEIIRSISLDGSQEGSSRSGLLQLAVILREYRKEFRLRKPPYLVQAVLFAILAPIGRLRGYKSRIE